MRALLAVLLLASCAHAGASMPTPSPIARRAGSVHAPELEGPGWLNSDRPLRLSRELKGRVVLLDFWTAGCINCIHTLPVLKAMEERFAKEPFQVVGVHSGKFEEEKNSERVAEAVARYGITHPVVVDSDFALWHAYAVKGWPTLVLVDADGYVIAQASGEPDRARLEQLIAAVLEDGKKRGVAAKGPAEFNRPREADTGTLRFPGKVAALDGDRVAIADTGHHRVLVTKSDGTLLATIGAGEEGFVDGTLASARFRGPQGVAGKGEVLYVADTGNHAIRRVDLAKGTVETVAGTGEKGHSPDLDGDPRKVALRSPWDVAWAGDALYVAMAGSHQLWKFDLKANHWALAAGSGREEIIDGPATKAALAQPSGLSLEGDTLFFADSEASAVRALELGKGEVRTLVGSGLFDFGDVDGWGQDAKLQHPLGVAALGKAVFVADTYNGKIRRIATDTRNVTSLTKAHALDEPGGLTVVDGKLLVADTNHHRLVWIDPADGAVRPFEVKLASTLPPAKTPEVALGPVAISPGQHTLTIEVGLPEHFHVNEQAPQRAKLAGSTGLKASEVKLSHDASRMRIAVPLSIVDGGMGSVGIDVSLYYCETGKEALCQVDRRRLNVSLTGETGAPTEPTLRWDVAH